jgi:polar amino acid transport system substrate-binding protein
MNKGFFRGIPAVLTAISVMWAAVGCLGSDKNSDNSDDTAATEPYSKYSAEQEANPDNISKLDPSLQNVYNNKKLIIGLDTSSEPMSFTDENGEVIGFDADVAQEICSRMDIDLEKQSVSRDTMENDLNEGRIDCIWSGMFSASESTDAMNISEAYAKAAMIFAVPADSDIKSADDLSGKTIAVQSGTFAQDILEASGLSADITISPADDNSAAIARLENGSADAVFLDSATANHIISSQNRSLIIIDSSLGEAEYAVVFRNADLTLRDEIQNQLNAMKQDGKLAEISEKWFGSDITSIK